LLFFLIVSSISCSRDSDELINATANGDVSKVRMLLDKGWNVNSRSIDRGNSGVTALLIATAEGHIDIVKELLNNGADVNIRDEYYNHTPLHLAASDGSLTIAKLLINEGAEVNAKESRHGDTPLHNAYSNHKKRMIELLIQNGGDINVQNNTGKRPEEMQLNPKWKKILAFYSLFIASILVFNLYIYYSRHKGGEDIIFLLLWHVVPIVLIIASVIMLLNYKPPSPSIYNHFHMFGFVALVIVFYLAYILALVGGTMVAVDAVKEITVKSESNRWRCPHCGNIFEKTSELEAMKAIGGRTTVFGKQPKCPSCSNKINTNKLLDGDYDI